MGVLNVTPDSFSDGSRWLDPARAVRRGLEMERQGADLIDIGAESTRPGAPAVTAKEEMRRLLPVVERLAKRLSVPISVDTSKPEVARAAIERGAGMVNDVTGLRHPAMAGVVARAGVPVIVMHMRGTPRTMRRLAKYRRVVPEVLAELKRSVERGVAAGIPRRMILVDPGIGFAKGPKESLALLNSLSAFKRLGVPVVVGPSRKSFIGHVLGAEVGDRLFGTAAAVALAVYSGADILRVHDVAEMRQVADLAHAVASAS
ncbi:MAG: dihydropteroate synthase [Candidatus Omnitrophica bacterium]|nr:dihydropteroate synthase [Candidatus Omnitrophota bacterium]